MSLSNKVLVEGKLVPRISHTSFDRDNELLARAICPKGKGWTWKKHGPLEFS